jgi:hypothetical protein
MAGVRGGVLRVGWCGRFVGNGGGHGCPSYTSFVTSGARARSFWGLCGTLRLRSGQAPEAVPFHEILMLLRV